MIKKIISVMLLCAALSAMVSCGGADINYASHYTAKELADAIMAVYGAIELPEEGFEYFFSGAADDDNYIDAHFAGYLIDGAYSTLEEYDNFSDCAFYIPKGRHIFEIDVLKAEKIDKNTIKILQDILERRLERITKSDVLVYTPKDAPLLENAKIITAGGYVILLATTDNKKAEQVINDMLVIEED